MRDGVDQRLAGRSRGVASMAAPALLAVAAALLCACGAPAPSATASTLPSMPPPLSTPIADGVAVPPTVDATGGADAAAPLQRWLAGVPDGSTVVFPAGGTFRLDRGLVVSARKGITFEGNGATLVGNGPASCGRDCSLFYLRGGSRGIVIRGFTLLGNSPTPGAFDPAWEQTSAIAIVGASQVEIADVTVRGVGGDALTLSGDPPAWPHDVWFHDSTVVSAGRNGVSVIAGTNVTVERVAVGRVGYTTFDIEPNTADQGASNVRFLDNTSSGWANAFLAANGAPGSSVNGVTVSGNMVSGASLLTVIDLPRRQNVVFSGNRSDTPAVGPVLRFAHVDGLVVVGNAQPLASGTLTAIADCTSVVTAP